MAKSGNLTKQEKFYIQQNPDSLTIHQLAKQLDRSPETVAKHYNQPTKPTDTTKEAVEKESKKTQMFELMGRHKRGGQNVATVMTPAASELADATRPERIKNQKIQKAIHRPID